MREKDSDKGDTSWWRAIDHGLHPESYTDTDKDRCHRECEREKKR